MMQRGKGEKGNGIRQLQAHIESYKNTVTFLEKDEREGEIKRECEG